MLEQDPVGSVTPDAPTHDEHEVTVGRPGPIDAPSHGERGSPSTLQVVLELSLWSCVAAVGALITTQALGWSSGGVVAAVQSLTPLASLLVIPVVGVAVASRRHALAGLGIAVLCGALVLSVPLVFPSAPSAAPGATETRITVVNLLYQNERIDDAADAVAATSPDVVVFTEYTAEHQAALLDHPLALELPHREERDGLAAGGTAVWSKFPLAPRPTPEMTNYDVDVVVGVPGASFRLWAVHPPYPFNPGWQSDLATVAERVGEIDEPLVVAGDFNASYWHPPFREILDRGMTSAHISNRRGWTTSWPTDRWFPSFVRIDHALTNDELAATGVADFDLPGSDHRGFVVTVAAAE